jgi:hypothetical protein
MKRHDWNILLRHGVVTQYFNCHLTIRCSGPGMLREIIAKLYDMGVDKR